MRVEKKLFLLLSLLALTGCGGSGGGSGADSGADSDSEPGSALVEDPLGGTGMNTEPGANSESQPNVGMQPFEQPNPLGATLLERRGYQQTIADADFLVSGRYLDTYNALADSLRDIGTPDSGSILNEATTYACPEGGSVVISHQTPDPTTADMSGRTSRLDFLLSDCRLPGLTLSGALTQDREISGSRFSNGFARTSTFSNVSLSNDDIGLIVITGAATVREISQFVPDCASSGALQTRENDVSVAQLEQVTSDSITRLQDAQYESRTTEGPTDDGRCMLTVSESYSGAASGMLIDAGQAAPGITLDLSKNGETSQVDSVFTARTGSLTALAGDGSSIRLTRDSTQASLAQADLATRAAATSIVVEFAFQP